MLPLLPAPAVVNNKPQIRLPSAALCLVFVVALLHPATGQAQLTQGPSGPFMAEDSTGRVIGVADLDLYGAFTMWITVDSVTAPIQVEFVGWYGDWPDPPPSAGDRWDYNRVDLHYASNDCSGQAYVTELNLFNSPVTPDAALPVVGYVNPTLYSVDTSVAPVSVTLGSRLNSEGTSCISETFGLRIAYPAQPTGITLASEFTPPFYVRPNPAYNTTSVPIGAPWALAVVLAAAYLNVLRNKPVTEQLVSDRE